MTFDKQFRVLKDPSSNSIVLQHKTNQYESLLIDPSKDGAVQLVDSSGFAADLYFLFDCYGLLDVYEVLVDGKQYRYVMCVTECKLVGTLDDGVEIFAIADVKLTPLGFDKLEHDFAHKSIRSGAFYFFWPNDGKFDLTFCAQKFAQRKENLPDIRFLWNRAMYLQLCACGAEPNQWMLMTICGCVTIEDIVMGSQVAKACLISRISCERSGTPFGTSGVNDEGQVANLIETEQLIYAPNGAVSSFVIITGSVPLFWSKLKPGAAKVQLFRGLDCSQPAFDRHFAALKYLYGKLVIVNLLGASPEEERYLASMFRYHYSHSLFKDEIAFIDFDYNRYCEKNEILLDMNFKKMIEPLMSDISIYAKDHSEQKGTFRVSCFDGLRRVTSVQAFIARLVLDQQLAALFPQGLDPLVKAKFIELYPQAWQRSAEQIRNCLASTSTLAHFPKQFIGDQLIRYTCLLPPGFETLMPEPLARPLVEAFAEFTVPAAIGVAVATWNIRVDGNARKWQWQVNWDYGKIDIFAIGLQEIINANQWETHLENELQKDGFTRVSTVQLQAPDKLNSPVSLFLFAKMHLIRFIRDVSTDVVMMKDDSHGGVAIRLRLYGTSIVFVCSHFIDPKGTLTVEHRNKHIALIESKLFNQTSENNCSVKQHDFVFWCGNLNYIFSCPIVQAKALAMGNKYNELAAFDQLKQQMDKGAVLSGFYEEMIHFEPTYLQKGQVPAWPDRVLFKKQSATRIEEAQSNELKYGQILFYNRVGIEDKTMLSYRPLMAEFEIEVLRVKPDKRDQVMSTIAASESAQQWTRVRRESASNNSLPINAMDKPVDIDKLTNYGSYTAERRSTSSKVSPTKSKVQASPSRSKSTSDKQGRSPFMATTTTAAPVAPLNKAIKPVNKNIAAAPQPAAATSSSKSESFNRKPAGVSETLTQKSAPPVFPAKPPAIEDSKPIVSVGGSSEIKQDSGKSLSPSGNKKPNESPTSSGGRSTSSRGGNNKKAMEPSTSPKATSPYRRGGGGTAKQPAASTQNEENDCRGWLYYILLIILFLILILFINMLLD